jgi:hypothetical protein
MEADDKNSDPVNTRSLQLRKGLPIQDYLSAGLDVMNAFGS